MKVQWQVIVGEVRAAMSNELHAISDIGANSITYLRLNLGSLSAVAMLSAIGRFVFERLQVVWHLPP